METGRLYVNMRPERADGLEPDNRRRRAVCPRVMTSVFGEWTTPVENGRMTDKPPYPHVVVGKRAQSVRTAGGSEAYTHLLLELWSFIPTVIVVGILLALTIWCVSTGALGFQAGWVAVTTFIILALVPIALSLSELTAWMPTKQTSR